VSITVLATGFNDSPSKAPPPSAVFSSPSSPDALDPSFYKNRRAATTSPLGKDANADDARLLVERGMTKEKQKKGKKEGGVSGFFR